MSNPQDYTIGWICAISTEYVAAQAFLDEKHEPPNCVSLNDNNDYTLGKVGKHNVVIAVLPDGEYGTSSAASVARDMLHSFPNVRIGLMVGIGGGAPSRKHDIRLGDVVVSAPRDGKGGVLQYDFGKTIQDQSFRPTGLLNQPPMVLRTAMNGLKAQYECEGHALEEAVERVLEKKPRLRRKYKRPDLSSDKLYRSEFVHPLNDEASCPIVCGDDPSRLVLRSERSEVDDNPSIHYGLIASANQLMKDASVRDTLAAEKDVLCFEMEASGLMNHLPCLVIRGICDYADSHKNKEWQGYAAMTATAYAKDLLSRIPLNKVEAERRIVDILSGVQEKVIDMSKGVDRLLRGQHDREHDTILEWLTPVDYAPQQNDYLRRRQLGTGQYLLDSAEYLAWLHTENQTLFCPGIPGAGKTIITAIAVEDLNKRFQKNQNIGIAYIYCNFHRKDEQKAEDLLASLLKQLSQGRPSLPDCVKALYDNRKDERTRPPFIEISEALHSVTATYSRVFIIIDALDECQVSDGCRTKLISEVFSLQAKCGANIFATSRMSDEIAKMFDKAVSFKIHARDEDVRTYLNGQMPHLQSDILDDDMREMIATEILNATDGMFLLAELHMNTLIGLPTRGDIKQALRSLAKGADGLDETYRLTMERIECQGSGYRELAKQILAWIVHAIRPLSTLELRHALAVRPHMVELDEDYLPSVEVLQSVCAGLVTVDEESSIVRLVHYTTQEYFERSQNHWFPEAEQNITTTCLTYLSFSTFESGFTLEEFDERLQQNPLYGYAARNWGQHARKSLILGQQTVDFLEKETHVEASVQAMTAVPWRTTGLHLAAYFGLWEAAHTLIQRHHGPDLKNAWGQTPLSLAAEMGHEATVKLLLGTDGVDPDSKDIGGRTPLSLAAGSGYDAVVKLLLESGRVDTESKTVGGYCLGETPLLLAAMNRHTAIVKLLPGTGIVDPDSKDTSGRTPLSHAAQNGQTTIIQLLLGQNVDADAKDDHGNTPLSWAAYMGQRSAVQLLLACEAVDVNSKDIDGDTPLSSAAYNGHGEIIKLLLNTANIDADLKNKIGQTPLSQAAERGHKAVIKLLLSFGVDVSAADENGRTPLCLAVMKDLATAKLLHKAGAEINERSNTGCTLLHEAAAAGQLQVTEWLIKLGLDVNATDSEGQGPLHKAVRNGKDDVAAALLQNGASADVADIIGCTPLHFAIYEGIASTVQLLLSRNANTQLTDGYGKSSFEWIQLHHHLRERVGILLTGPSDSQPKYDIHRLRRSVWILSSRLLDTNGQPTSPGYHQLGHCLMYLQHSAEALTAYEQQILDPPNNSGVAHRVVCHTCQICPIYGVRYVCTNCPDIDLCAYCWLKYEEGVFPNGCYKHNFMTIPGPNFARRNSNNVNASGETRIMWLERIKDTFGKQPQE